MVELITAEIEKAKQEGYKLIVVNAAVLQKMGLVPVVDEVWAVIAPLLLRVKRLLKKGYSNEEIYCRAGTQPKDSGYKTVADEIILNNGTLKQLRQKTLSLLSAS
jgi:dephospho-CoA kinase